MALDATSLKEDWRDDDVPFFAKFNPPTVADGKVFLATFANPDTTHPVGLGWLIVYGMSYRPTTVGVYRPPNTPFNQTAEGKWLLRNSNTPINADISFVYGGPGDIPVVGDWTGNGTTTIGVYRPPNTPLNRTTEGKWLLRNSNTPGDPDSSFRYGGPGDTPVVGSWSTRWRHAI